MDHFKWLDALSLAKLIRDKQVTSDELVEVVLNRITKVNPKINAVNSLLERNSEQPINLQHDHDLSGIFSGVPFLMKDLEFFAGTRYTGGSNYLKNFIAPVDSELVSRIRKSGFETIGKTNTCEFGIQPITEPSLFGPTRNPWNTNYTAGGSSGGAAAAVAAGIVPVAHASDGGGSIRIPASCCGLFGLKISRGRNPKSPDPVGISISHCISRSVRDSAAFLDAIHGSALGDPYSAPPFEGSFLEEVSKTPRKLRIGFLTTAFDGSPIHKDCSDAVKDAVNLLEGLGHEVIETKPTIDVKGFTDAFTTLWYQLLLAGVTSMERLVGRKPTGDDFEPLTWEIVRQAREMTANQYLNSVAYMQMVSREMAFLFTKYDLLLSPTLSKPPVKIGEISYQDNLEEYSKVINEWVPYTPVANATGIPAMNVPLYWNQEGLPIGVHFMAPYGDEATLFQLAGQLEEARPWKERYPAVSV
ncbi:amidase [Litchfieldia salsa]|uniref:Amidase n=1 Tax=Litchfieldia salsa TaxID=930152 RepID=A0A1H0U7X0_9BACI|nr:amidase [Litchfieldia salsa]SDP62254.1 amidase [Litchfieldia salsa]